MPKVIFLLADYGHDPTEVAVPYGVFEEAGFDIDFATEKGTPPQCDKMMLEGMTGAMLGADATAKKAYAHMSSTSTSFKQPRSWSDPTFSLDSYDLLFLAGGHEKSVRQVIDSSQVHRLISSYFPLTDRDSTNKKVVGAICHGVQVLAFTPEPNAACQQFPIDKAGQIVQDEAGNYKSIVHLCTTTGLPGFLENTAYQMTRLFLGDYYKTYGVSTPSVEDYVKIGLDKADQFVTGPGIFGGASKPMLVEDTKYRYVSGRFSPDAEILAKRCVSLVNETLCMN